MSICVDMMVALEFFILPWSVYLHSICKTRKISTGPPICRTVCFLFYSIQDQNAVTLSGRHFVYFFFLPSDKDGLWSSCHCFCLLGANPHQDVTPGLRKRKQFQRIGDENLATWTRNQWDRKLRSILRIILSWSKSFCPLLIEIRIFTSAF